MKIRSAILIVHSAMLLLPPVLHADTTVSTDTTQNGGTFTVSPPTLLVTHGSNDPTLTLTNGATTSGIEAVIVGNLSGQSGNLEILGGSTLSNEGNGSLIQAYGGNNVYQGSGYLGLNAGSSGNVLISGGGSTWNGREVSVGYLGEGVLVVEDGGSVAKDYGRIGHLPGSVGGATISGDGSSWSSLWNLTVGDYGIGNLLIENGGSVSNYYTGIGGNGEGEGSVRVTGAGSQLNAASSIYVGFAGKGTLVIENGALVASSSGEYLNHSYIGRISGSEGGASVSREGSHWDNRAAFFSEAKERAC